jgi:hypothetical protein
MMSPFILIALAALLGFIVGWFAHGPKEDILSSGAVARSANPLTLAAEISKLNAKIASLETTSAGLEAMVHGRDATIILMAEKIASYRA